MLKLNFVPIGMFTNGPQIVSPQHANEAFTQRKPKVFKYKDYKEKVFDILGVITACNDNLDFTE